MWTIFLENWKIILPTSFLCLQRRNFYSRFISPFPSQFSAILENFLCPSLPAPLAPIFLLCYKIFWCYKIQTKMYWHIFLPLLFLPSNGLFQKNKCTLWVEDTFFTFLNLLTWPKIIHFNLPLWEFVIFYPRDGSVSEIYLCDEEAFRDRSLTMWGEFENLGRRRRPKGGGLQI